MLFPYQRDHFYRLVNVLLLQLSSYKCNMATIKALKPKKVFMTRL